MNPLGKANSMKSLLKREWEQRVNNAARLTPGQALKRLPLKDGKFERIPFEQIVARAASLGFTTNVTNDSLWIATKPKEAA